jgi:uncharacterized protein YuzE
MKIVLDTADVKQAIAQHLVDTGIVAAETSLTMTIVKLKAGEDILVEIDMEGLSADVEIISPTTAATAKKPVKKKKAVRKTKAAAAATDLPDTGKQSEPSTDPVATGKASGETTVPAATPAEVIAAQENPAADPAVSAEVDPALNQAMSAADANTQEKAVEQTAPADPTAAADAAVNPFISN